MHSLPALSQAGPESVSLARNRIVMRSMKTLTGWGALNSAVGIGLSSGAGKDARYTFRTCTYFGLVNLALGQVGYWTARKKRGEVQTQEQNIREQRKTEKVFLINTGLDLVYMAGGLHLINRSKQKTGDSRDKSLGYGRGLMIQGGFLFLFDGIQYLTHRKNGKGLDGGGAGRPSGRLEAGLTGTGVCLRLKL
ncbi:MAG: hypothetical protein IPP73_05790 [Chitinophagaceae bacterium]|nr:hypothetical protein [Chitinophagaceae bacterium]